MIRLLTTCRTVLLALIHKAIYQKEQPIPKTVPCLFSSMTEPEALSSCSASRMTDEVSIARELRAAIMTRFLYHLHDHWTRDSAIQKAAEDTGQRESLVRRVVAHVT